jgi:hypothetical protein
VFRAVLVGAAIAAAAIGGAATASASPLPMAPLPFVTCSAGTYQNVDGNCVPDPEQAPSAPPGATAMCRDGDYSFSQHRSGTCSGHGGVAQWLSS